MKTKLITIIILICYSLILLSCEKEDITEHYEQIIIIDAYTYSYSDSYNPNKGWIDYMNGDYKYFFDGNTVHPTQKIRQAEYLRSTFDKTPVQLEITNNSVSYNATVNGVFRFYY